MSSDLESILRRLKPHKHQLQLQHREKSELPFLGNDATTPGKLLYDTTVYVDLLQGRFPYDTELMLRPVDVWHSTVTEAELAVLCGLLDPTHPDTPEAVAAITESIGRRSRHRTLAPDRGIWIEAGVLAGMLSRLQQYGNADRRRVLNDALLFSTAQKHGLTILTRNVADFDFLQQLDPRGRVLFY